MLDKYFVPYDRAKKLKSLKFKEECFGSYADVEVSTPILVKRIISDDQGGYFTLAPLFCQSFDWFREKFGYFSSPTQSTALGKGVTYDWLITKDLDNGKVFVALVGYKGSYEEAQLACLDKLIEICEKSVV